MFDLGSMGHAWHRISFSLYRGVSYDGGKKMLLEVGQLPEARVGASPTIRKGITYNRSLFQKAD